MIALALRRVAALPVAAVLVVAGLAAPQTATATPKPTSVASSGMQTSQIRLRGSTRAMPSSKLKGGTGALNVTEDGQLQRFVNRSNSPRPKVIRNRGGVRVLARSASPSWLPRVAATRLSGTRPGAVKGWEGLNETDNQKFNGFNVEPPDQGLCAGGGHVFEMINDVVRTYTTGGAAQRTATLNDFFREPKAAFTTDPNCLYDAGSQRFFVSELTLEIDPKTGGLTERNWLDLAVSKTADPRGGWNIYTINATDDGTGGSPAHKSCPCIGDFPQLGTDANGVFLTTNEYPFAGDGEFGNGFNGAQVYALSKKKVTAGAAKVSMVHFENVRAPLVSGPGRVGFTLWPARTVGRGYPRAAHGTMYFVSSFAAVEARPDDFTGHSDEMGTWWIGNTASLDHVTPQLSLSERTLRVGSYGVPPLSNQKAGPVPLRDCLTVTCQPKLSDIYAPEQEGGLDSSDSRVLTASYVNGTLVAALDTAVQVNQNVQAGFEWMTLRASGAKSAVTSRGYVGVNSGNVIYPAIVTNTKDRGYVGFTLTGDQWYPSAGYATWSARTR